MSDAVDIKRETIREAIDILRSLPQQDQLTINKYVDEQAAIRHPRTEEIIELEKKIQWLVVEHNEMNDLLAQIENICDVFGGERDCKKNLLLHWIYKITRLAPR